MKPSDRTVEVVGIWLIVISNTYAFCGRELAHVFEDCTPFKDSRYFDGPVCGSDGDTYPNRMYVRCLNYKRKSEIRVSYKGPCTSRGQICPYSPIYKPVCATDKKTYANIEALICLATLDYTTAGVGVLHEGECDWDQIDPCPRNNWEYWGIDLVCGNNGLTYSSIAQIHCLRKTQPDLQVIHEGGCSLLEASRIAALTRNQACWLAKNRYEWNPICGTNNVTYPNPFVVLCHHPEIKAQFVGECDNPSHLSCLKEKENLTMLDTDTAVCGSDGLVYRSEDHLYCATAEDKYLWPQHSGKCTLDDDPCKYNDWTEMDTAGIPVCASDGNTYVSPYAIWCAQRNENPCLKFVHDGPCFPEKELSSDRCSDSDKCDNVPLAEV